MSTADVSALIKRLDRVVTTMSNDDYSKAGTAERDRHVERLVALLDVIAALSLPNGGEGPDGAYTPQVLEMGREGDPCWEFVERDCLTITGEVFAANVEQIFDANRKLIGFRIYKPAAPVPPSAGAEGPGASHASPLTAGWTPNERLCFDRAMKQWEGSLQRPDLSDQDRVAGALEAYIRQAYAIRILSALEPSHDTRAKALEEWSEEDGEVQGADK